MSSRWHFWVTLDWTCSCKGKSPENIRSWYMAFTTLQQPTKRKYVQLYFGLHKDHVSSPKEFSVGDDDNYIHYDLPSWYHTSIDTLRQQIHQALLHKNIFPVGTCDEQINILNTHAAGNGYEALLTILQMDHPIYHHCPTTIIRREPPRQKQSEVLNAYYYQYIDYLKLKAYLKDIDKDLDLPDELDDFIDGIVHAAEFQKLIREDQKSKGDPAANSDCINDIEKHKKRLTLSNIPFRGCNLLPKFNQQPRTQTKGLHSIKRSNQRQSNWKSQSKQLLR